jgi:hypothetical protein
MDSEKKREDKNRFPGYEPKRTPDTINDYVRGENRVFEILDSIGPKRLDNIGRIIKCFKLYQQKASNIPGTYKKGHPELGANREQYYPSDEELVVSELGIWILDLLKPLDEKTYRELKQKHSLESEKIMFHRISFRHVDVMGSGRYFYAEKEPKKTALIL